MSRGNSTTTEKWKKFSEDGGAQGLCAWQKFEYIFWSLIYLNTE